MFRQLNLVIEDPKKRLIAGHFVNALESSGWIGMTVEEVADASGSSVEEADAVLATLQTFEPTGLVCPRPRRLLTPSIDRNGCHD